MEDNDPIPSSLHSSTSARRLIRQDSLLTDSAGSRSPARFSTAPTTFKAFTRAAPPVPSFPEAEPIHSAPEPLGQISPAAALPLTSVVKILVVATSPDYTTPWQVKQQFECSGSGFVLDGRRIITNAHVVANWSIVRIKKYNSADLYPARVLSIAHVCDLALITVDDDKFWEGLPSLKLAPLPQLYEDIMVIGYPIGGDNICVTRGIVSRIDTMSYSTRPLDNTPELLVVQIDAAINFGNSGGPACHPDGDVVGVAFCGLSKASNIGYIIPLPVIMNFLQQYEQTQKFVGVCEVGLSVQDMMNHSLREKFQMKEEHSGVLVLDVEPLAPVFDVLKKHDVLLAIDGVSIANDGTIAYGNSGLRLRLSVLITSHAVGDSIKFTVLRDGKQMEMDVKMGPVPKLVPTFHGFDAFPSYYVIGGLVFTILTMPFMNQIFARGDDVGSMMMSLSAAIHTQKKTHDHQYVILHRILIADVNFGYGMHSIQHLCAVNDVKVNNLKELITAVAKNTNKFLHFTFEENGLIVLDAELCKKTEQDILKQHAIPSPVSGDLLEFYSSLQSS